MENRGGCAVGVPTDAQRGKKLVLMHQASQCEFQRGFKFSMEDRKVAVEIEKSLFGGIKAEDLIEYTFFV